MAQNSRRLKRNTEIRDQFDRIVGRGTKSKVAYTILGIDYGLSDETIKKIVYCIKPYNDNNGQVAM